MCSAVRTTQIFFYIIRALKHLTSFILLWCWNIYIGTISTRSEKSSWKIFLDGCRKMASESLCPMEFPYPLFSILPKNISFIFYYFLSYTLKTSWNSCQTCKLHSVFYLFPFKSAHSIHSGASNNFLCNFFYSGFFFFHI
jgi:hypothetical protein